MSPARAWWVANNMRDKHLGVRRTASQGDGARTSDLCSDGSGVGPGKIFQHGTVYILFMIFHLDHLYSRAYSSISWNIWTPTAPWRAYGAPKFAKNRAKSRKIARKMDPCSKEVLNCLILTRFELFGSSKDKESLSLRLAPGVTSGIH